jgi:hypothetical protein
VYGRTANDPNTSRTNCRQHAIKPTPTQHFMPTLPPSAQLLGFCLFSTLKIIVGLQEEKPSTLPIADRTCLF